MAESRKPGGGRPSRGGPNPPRKKRPPKRPPNDRAPRPEPNRPAPSLTDLLNSGPPRPPRPGSRPLAPSPIQPPVDPVDPVVPVEPSPETVNARQSAREYLDGLFKQFGFSDADRANLLRDVDGWIASGLADAGTDACEL